MLEILERITEGKGQPGDIELEELVLPLETAPVRFGQTAPNPVLAHLLLRHEYEEHINAGAPAGVCSNLISYFIIKDKCVGCTVCARTVLSTLFPVNVTTSRNRSIYLHKMRCLLREM